MSTGSSRSTSLIPVPGKQFGIVSDTGSIGSSDAPFSLGNVIDLAIRMDAHVLPSLLELGNDVPIVEPISVGVLVFYESYDLMQQHKDTLDKRKSILSQGTHLADHVMQKVNFANIGQFTSTKLVCYNATYCENEEMRPATPGSPYLAGKELETAIIEVQNAPSNFEPPPIPIIPSQLMEWEFDEMKSRITHAAMVVCDAGSILYDAKWSVFTQTKKYARINECIDGIQKSVWSCINLIREVDQRIKKAMDENRIPHKFVERTRYNVTRQFTLSSDEKARIAECNQQLNQTVIEFIRSITKWNSLFYVSEREKDPRLNRIKVILRATLFDSLVKQHLKTYKYRKDWLHNEVVQWLSVIPSSSNQEVAVVLPPTSSSRSGGRGDGSCSGGNNAASADERNRLFWYRAGAGQGKSVFTAALVDRLNRYYPGQMLGVVFLKFNDTQQSRPVVVLRSLLYQLVRNIPELTECVLAGVESLTQDQLNSADRIQTVFMDALSVLNELRASAGACRNTVIIFDALDEAYPEGSEERPAFIAWLTDFIASLPVWVKLFVTSREQAGLTSALKSFTSQRRYSIDESDPRNVRDVQFYLNHIVVQTIPPSLTPELGFLAAKEATGVLLQKSEGTFVYLAIIADKLDALFTQCKGDVKMTLVQYQEFLMELPDGISTAYLQRFNEIFKSAPLVKSMELLQVLVCVQEPLTKAELEEFLLMESVYSTEINELIDHFSGLFVLRDTVEVDGQIRFNVMHRVLCDWLTNASLSGPYYCNPLKGHNLIAKRLLQKLQVECRLSEGCAVLQDPVALSKRLTDYLSLDAANSALRSYLFKHLLTHLDHCMDTDPKLRMLSYHLLTSPVWLRCQLQQVGLQAVWRECVVRVSAERWLSDCVECRENLEGVERCLGRILQRNASTTYNLTSDGGEVKLLTDGDGETAGSSNSSNVDHSSEVINASLVNSRSCTSTVCVSAGGGYSDDWLDSVCGQVTATLEEMEEIRRLNQVVEPAEEEEADY